jgi:cytochrome P450
MTLAAASAATWLAGYFTALVAELRRRPGPDLTSALIQAQPGTGGLSDGRIIACLFLLILAGAESAAKLLGNAWYQSHLHPAARRAGLDGQAAGWVTETLRHDSPGQMMARTLTAQTVLHGTAVPSGARVALLLGSAHRDGAVFADPGRFDLDRRDHARAIPFGHGPHYCLGAALARLEARIALEELGAVIADYEVGMAAARRSRSPHLRGHTSLPCSVTPRSRTRRAGG